MIGRREGKRGSREKLLSSSNQANADSVRDFFDQKVAEVVRKEAIADKLAQEWEEHFELSTKKEELIENGGEGYEEEAQSLELQLRFKEDKIRQLAQRLGKQRETTKASSSKTELFLFDEEFKRFCSGTSYVHKTYFAERGSCTYQSTFLLTEISLFISQGYQLKALRS